MTKEKNDQEIKQEDILAKSSKKLNFQPKSEDNFVWRGIILLLFVFAAMLSYGYVAYKDHKTASLDKKMSQEAQKIINSDNLESKIYDLEQDKDAAQKKTENLGNLELGDDISGEKKAKTSKSTDKITKIEDRIDDLSQKIDQFEKKIEDSIKQKQLNNIILAYAKFRKKLLQGQDLKIEFENLQLLAQENKEISQKISELEPFLKEFKSDDAIQQEFLNLQPLLLARKNYDPNQGFVSRFRYNMNKIFIVKNLKDSDRSDIERLVIIVDKLIKDRKYQIALENIKSVDEKYQSIFRNFTQILEKKIKLEIIDKELSALFIL